MKIISNARFIGLAIICAMFCFGQDTWPPTTTISVEQDNYLPAQHVKLISSNAFFHVLTEDDPVGTKTVATIEGQEIPIQVVNETEALFPLPYIPTLTGRTQLTGIVDGVPFTVEVDPPVPAPGGTANEINTFLARYQQMSQIANNLMLQWADTQLTNPDENAAYTTAVNAFPDYSADLESNLQDLMVSYPDAADILASILHTSGVNDLLLDYINNYSGGLPSGKANCSVAYALAVVDTLLGATMELGTVIGFGGWAGASAIKLFSSAGGEVAVAMAQKLGAASGKTVLGAGMMRLITPAGGGDENDLILTAPDRTLQIGLPGEEAPLWVQAELETENDSFAGIFNLVTNRMGWREYGVSFEFHGLVFEVILPLLTSLMPDWWDQPFGLRTIIVDVPSDEVEYFTVKELMIEIFPDTSPDADCNQMVAQALFVPGDVEVQISWLAFNRLFTENITYTIIKGPLMESWSEAEGVYYGSDGEINGDLGVWKYHWGGTQMTTPPCDRRIEISGGVLTAYECHHELSGDGSGMVWVWLDNFHEEQQFFPLDYVVWDFSADGVFGPDGYAYFFVGQLMSGMHNYTSGGMLSPAGLDYMCLRPPNHEPEARGSMYFGAILYSNYHEEEPDYSESQLSISGIELMTSEAMVDIFPPDESGPFTEDFRGITETYRPFITGVLPIFEVMGYVNIPGTFGRWAAHFMETQGMTAPCAANNRVEVENGTVTVHSCHHEYFDDGQGYVRFQLEDMFMRLPDFNITHIAWDLDHTAPGADTTDVLSIGISDYGRWDSPGGVAYGSLNMDPVRSLILVGDGTIWPDFAFKGRVKWNAAPSEVNEFQLNVSEITITGMQLDEQKKGDTQRFTYDGQPIPVYNLGNTESDDSMN